MSVVFEHFINPKWGFASFFFSQEFNDVSSVVDDCILKI